MSNIKCFGYKFLIYFNSAALLEEKINYTIKFVLSKKLAQQFCLNPKTTLGGKWGVQHPCGFLKIVSSKQIVKPWFFVTFKIIIRHIFPENFIEIL